MSRPTPETDARTYVPSLGASTVPAEFARKLERERDEAREERDKLQVMRKEVVAANKGAKINAQVSNSLAGKLNQAERERDEARELLRILVGLVAYGLGQSGEEWSLDAMRQATSAIQKSLEESK